MSVAGTETSLAEGQTSAKPRVLIADDNQDLALIWSFVLEDAGYDVTVVANGGDALAELTRTTFDVAILDLQLPDLSGLELFTALRADNPDTEGIIITGHASMESAIEAVNRSIYSYLVKPVGGEVLRVMVDRAVERHRLRMENRIMLAHLSALRAVMETALETVGLTGALQRILVSVADAVNADGASLLLLDEGGYLSVVASHPTHEGDQPFRLAPGDGFAGRVFSECRPMQISDTQAQPILRNPRLRQAGVRAIVGVPVLSGGRPIGVLQVEMLRPRVYEDREMDLLQAIAQRIALAIDKSQLMDEREEHLRQLEDAYRRERHIAETLQRSFLPGVQVEVPGIRVAHLYQAGMAEAQVGGDFYDVVEITPGQLALVMGDVSGKGLDAAVYTALTKYTLRSYALEDPDPVHVVSRLNYAFHRQATPETFATLFYGLLDIRQQRLTYVNAGHEAGLLYRPSTGVIEWLTATGPVAGVLEHASYESAEAEFTAEDMLLLYTDGASEARRGKELLGTEGIEKLLAANAGNDPQETLAGVYQGILDFARGGLRDDTALLLVCRQKDAS